MSARQPLLMPEQASMKAVLEGKHPYDLGDLGLPERSVTMAELKAKHVEATQAVNDRFAETSRALEEAAQQVGIERGWGPVVEKLRENRAVQQELEREKAF